MLAVSSKVLDHLTPSQRDVTQSLADTFGVATKELYLVGGIVRDALLGRAKFADLDFATSARPSHTRELLESVGASSVYLVGERFGTIGAVFGAEPDRMRVEVTTYRRETHSGEETVPAGALDAPALYDLAP